MIARGNSKKLNPSSGERPLMCSRALVSIVFLCLTFCTTYTSAQTGPQQPHVLGIAHIAFDVADPVSTRTFYRSQLGFDQVFSLKRPNGADWIGFIKVNDQQYVELFSVGSRFAGRLDHFALYTDDLMGMKAYVTARGVRLVEPLHKGRTGDNYFSIQDPDGHLIEIVEYQPDSWSAREKGNFIGPDRLSDHISHVGIVVGSMAAALRFYHDILGFRTFAQDMTSGAAPQWANARVPNGTDYLVLLSQTAPPQQVRRNAEIYVGFSSSSLERTIADLNSRTSGHPQSRPLSIEPGTDNNRRTSVFDPDGIRIDFAEPAPTPGKP